MIQETDCLRVLGVDFKKNWSSSVDSNYKKLIASLKATLQLNYVRKLSIIERCQVLNIFILSKLWYVAQIFPPSNSYIGQIKAACGKFIWVGQVFKINRNQLYLDYLKGGLRLVDPESKCKALFIKNILYNVDVNGDMTEETFLLTLNQPQRLSRNAREWIEISKHLKNNFNLCTTKLLYDYFIDEIHQPPKVEADYAADWSIIWENLSKNFLTLVDRSNVYLFLNDVISNKEKLLAYNIGNLASSNCVKCGLIDSNFHRIKSCLEAKKIWAWCSDIIRNRLKLKFKDMEDILQFPIQNNKKELKAALWLTVRAISINVVAQGQSLFIFKKGIRELRWNNRAAFRTEFGTCLNIC